MKAIRGLPRGLALAALPLAASLALGLVALRPAPPPAFKASTLPLTCQHPPVFTPGYQRRPNYVVPQAEGFRFRSESWVEADVCSAGTLSVTAAGELGGDELPQLTVVLGTSVLATPRFDRQRRVSMAIPGPGRVILGYFNDYYLADVRVATLRDVALVSPTCKGFKSVNVPVESAGIWYPEAHVASLVHSPPMTLLPCAAGRLTLRALGREGNGAFPLLVFRQGGQVIKTQPTDLTWQELSLEVTAAPLTIAVGNPYGKTLADRNLNVSQISFTPDVR